MPASFSKPHLCQPEGLQASKELPEGQSNEIPATILRAALHRLHRHKTGHFGVATATKNHSLSESPWIKENNIYKASKEMTLENYLFISFLAPVLLPHPQASVAWRAPVQIPSAFVPIVQQVALRVHRLKPLKGNSDGLQSAIICHEIGL